jgi:WD40 repeat protein/tRNA A-37 threonylcarbamoyl transferase component Bud32
MTQGGIKAKDIFLEALDLEPDQREDFLQSSCAGDESLRSRVDALLEAHDGSEALDGWLGKGFDVDPLPGPDGDGKPIGSIGDYELLEKIASGAMGTVYRARQKSLDRIVALKVLRVGRFATEEEVRRFRAEAEAVARLDHPNIVPVYDVGESEQRNFFSMKLIGGPGLDAVLQSFRDDPRRVASLMATAARGVHHAHQHGLLHRDLKPSNILLDTDGAPHIVDFGVAKRVGDDALETNPGMIVGTPAYMAPEQLTADGEITVRTDVYSLGCVLYELLTGRLPFTGDSITDLFHEVREKEAPSVAEQGASVPRDLAIICHKCLSKDPLERYGSTLALAEDLERWLDHIPIQARPTSFLERAGLYWRRKPLQASLTATVALLVITLAIGATTTSFVLREYLNRAIGAETTAKERLRTALLAQAEATLRGDLPGRRHESLELLEQAAQIDPGTDLRDEAIKAMTLTDLRTVYECRFEGDERTIGWDFERDRFVLANTDGGCSLRARDNEVLAELPEVKAQGWGAQFSPDGRLLAVKYHGARSADDPLLVIWDIERNEIVFRAERALPNQSMRFHPDGESFLAGSLGRDVALIDTRSLEARTWCEAEGPPVCLRFRPDGREVAVAIKTPQVIELRSYPGGDLVRRLELDIDPMSIDWSPDGERLLVGAEDSVAYVLDATTGEVVQELKGHQAEVVFVHSLGRNLAATSSWDETTRMWDLRTGETLIISQDVARRRSRDGRHLAYTNRGLSGVWSVDHGDVLRVFHGHTVKGPRWTAVSPSGRWMASGGDDDTLLWSLEEKRLIGSLGTGNTSGLFFSRVEDTLYAATEDFLYRWRFDGMTADPLSVEPEVVLTGQTLRTTSSADETVFASSVGSNVHIRVPDDPARDIVLEGVSGMNRAYLSPDGTFAAASSWRGRGVRVWRVATGEIACDLVTDYAETSAAFSPDGERLITGTPEDYYSWKVGTWELEYRLPRALQPTNLPGTIEFDRTGKLVAVAASTRVLSVLDAAPGETLMSHDAADSHPLTRMAFLPGARGIAAATSGRRILLWNLEQLIAELRQRGLDYGLDRWPVF